MEKIGDLSGTCPDEQFDKNFKPKGAITFFILLVILGLIIWYGIYFLMLSRI
ncbi:MAG: cytochrome c oxidase subunit 2A [Flavisolibacter sp.]